MEMIVDVCWIKNDNMRSNCDKLSANILTLIQIVVLKDSVYCGLVNEDILMCFV